METAAIVIQATLALVFTASAAFKLGGAEQQVKYFNEYRYPQWFRSVTGLVELVGVAGLIAGVWVPELAIAAGLWLGATMVGAVYSHQRAKHPSSILAAPLILEAALIAVIVLQAIELD